jgi:hypothetical protein
MLDWVTYMFEDMDIATDDGWLNYAIGGWFFL